MRLITYFISILILLGSCNFQQSVDNPHLLQCEPIMKPDYAGATIPVTIAPLNFSLSDTFDIVDVLISGTHGEAIHLQGEKVPEIPMHPWKLLLKSNVRDRIEIKINIKREGSWYKYNSVYLYVSEDAIDESLCYRLIAPGYEVYSKMGIYQRTLSDYKERAVLENTLVEGSCVNCHSFKQTDPSYFTLHVRGTHGGTFIKTPGDPLKTYSTKTDSTISACVYPYWHPSGKYIAYSNNETRQTFHTREFERIEVFDFKSDISVYDIDSNQLISSPLLRTMNYETYPVFSKDGNRLFFCVAEQQKMPQDIRKVRYNLCAIDFDAETGTFDDKIDTLYKADSFGKSVAFPRPSYDGRYILFTLVDYGQFPIWHKEADLWMLNLSTGSIISLDGINSDDTESYHSWSSNSKWVAFGSRRGDGLYTRVYLAHIDKDGHAGKAFLLPQQDPETYYEELLYSYNIPEFCNGTLILENRTVENQLLSTEKPSFTYKMR